MTATHLAVECRTNVPKQSIKKDFLSKFTEFLHERFNTEAKNIQVDIQADVLMMRAGSSSPMMNMNFYHNSDKIDQGSKTACASSIAKFMADELNLPYDRRALMSGNGGVGYRLGWGSTKSGRVISSEGIENNRVSVNGCWSCFSIHGNVHELESWTFLSFPAEIGVIFTFCTLSKLAVKLITKFTFNWNTL